MHPLQVHPGPGGRCPALKTTYTPVKFIIEYMYVYLTYSHKLLNPLTLKSLNPRINIPDALQNPFHDPFSLLSPPILENEKPYSILRVPDIDPSIASPYYPLDSPQEGLVMATPRRRPRLHLEYHRVGGIRMWGLGFRSRV